MPEPTVTRTITQRMQAEVGRIREHYKGPLQADFNPELSHIKFSNTSTGETLGAVDVTDLEMSK